MPVGSLVPRDLRRSSTPSALPSSPSSIQGKTSGKSIEEERKTRGETALSATARPIKMVLMLPDRFLSELTSMYERSTEKGSVWVTMKRSSLKCQAKLKKMEAKGEAVEYRCLVRATDGKKNISTSLSAKEYLKFQASYATVLKAHMHALKKRERKDRKKTAEAEKIPEKPSKKQKKASSKKPAGSKS